MATVIKLQQPNQKADYVNFLSHGKNIYIISDLHLAGGINKNGNFRGTENFYADHSFERFITHLQTKVANEKAVLVINGDFIDFLRITDLPTDDEFSLWQEMLEDVGIKKTLDELRTSIVKKEKAYGLKTNDYKSVWKLNVCVNGHRVLFKKLADWINDGNELMIVKGNHDLEWHWPAVQNYLRVVLINFLKKEKLLTVEQVSNLPRQIHFIEHAVVINNKIYIEHGHQHERTTLVEGSATINNSTELNLPFGSFFNRYLINRLELSYPFLDNVRPAQNILPVLIRERFPLAIKVMFQYIPLLLLIIPKKLYVQTFKYLLNILFVIVLPVALTVYAIWQTIKGGTESNFLQGTPSFILNLLQNFGFLFLSYIFGRILAMAGLKSPPTLSVYAKDVITNHPQVEAVVYGHTHNPDQRQIADDKWYFNTGTWIPILETSSADVRFDKTYTFIAINCNRKPVCSQLLQRWNDDAGRTDVMTINDKM